MQKAEELKSNIEAFLSSDVTCEEFLERIMGSLGEYKNLLRENFSDNMSREDALSQAEWALETLSMKYVVYCDVAFNIHDKITECSLAMPKPYASR